MEETERARLVRQQVLDELSELALGRKLSAAAPLDGIAQLVSAQTHAEDDKNKWKKDCQ